MTEELIESISGPIDSIDAIERECLPILGLFGILRLAKLDEAVKATEEAGLYVALTCREGPGRRDFDRSPEIWQDAAAQEAYARMWREIASHYRGRGSIVGYDLMCEQHPDHLCGRIRRYSSAARLSGTLRTTSSL